MKLLLRTSALIDAMNARIGRSIVWLVLVVVLISAANASVRYLLNASSNAWLEVQWYLFSAIFLLCAGYTLLKNEHIRIDVITGRFPPRVHAWIDLLGGVLFLMPMVVMIVWMSVPMVVESFARGEMSSNAGGLIRWPVKLLMPVGFVLLGLQGFSEIVKRAAFLMGLIADPTPAHAAHGGES